MKKINVLLSFFWVVAATAAPVVAVQTRVQPPVQQKKKKGVKRAIAGSVVGGLIAVALVWEMVKWRRAPSRVERHEENARMAGLVASPQPHHTQLVDPAAMSAALRTRAAQMEEYANRPEPNILRPRHEGAKCLIREHALVSEAAQALAVSSSSKQSAELGEALREYTASYDRLAPVWAAQEAERRKDPHLVRTLKYATVLLSETFTDKCWVTYKQDRRPLLEAINNEDRLHTLMTGSDQSFPFKMRELGDRSVGYLIEVMHSQAFQPTKVFFGAYNWFLEHLFFFDRENRCMAFDVRNKDHVQFLPGFVRDEDGDITFRFFWAVQSEHLIDDMTSWCAKESGGESGI